MQALRAATPFTTKALCLLLSLQILSGCDIKTAWECGIGDLYTGEDVVPVPPGTASVQAVAETDPVEDACDAADDPAIWVNPENPAESLIIGTNKKRGLVVYDLNGKTTFSRDAGRVNNVDLRANITISGQDKIILAATNRTTFTIDVYELDPISKSIKDILSEPIPSVFAEDPYGLCMYQSAVDNALYVIANDKAGAVAQWRLDDTGNDAVRGTLVRQWALNNQTEGCVADDVNGSLFIGEEEVGLWRFGAEPTDPTTSPTLIDTVGVGTPGGGNIFADLEGISLYAPAGGTKNDGYLIASSQGNNSYLVYDRAPPHTYRGRISIADGKSVDGSGETDGLDVTSANLGPQYPEGMLIVQDGYNFTADGKRENQNFKMVSWADVTKALNLE